MKNKKGFTLVELSVVIAIIAIILTMASSFMITFNRQSKTVEKNSVAVDNVNGYKELIKEFITANDVETVTITCPNSSTLKAGDETLAFDKSKKQLVWSGASGQKKTFYSEEITACEFSVKSDGGMVYCKATYLESEIKFAYNVFSKTERDRFSTTDRYEQ